VIFLSSRAFFHFLETEQPFQIEVARTNASRYMLDEQKHPKGFVANIFFSEKIKKEYEGCDVLDNMSFEMYNQKSLRSFDVLAVYNFSEWKL
jgi:hypothetical protein